jgi:hypothetical protein
MDVTPVVQTDYTFCATCHEPTKVDSMLEDTARGWIEAILLPKGIRAGALQLACPVNDTFGYKKLFIQTDAKNSATALAKSVAIAWNVFTRVAPNDSHQSQGAVERATQTFQGLMRSHVSSLE